MKRRILGGVVAALAVIAMTTGAGAASGSTVRGTEGAPGVFTCAVAPGHYCAKIFYVSVTGGIDLRKTESIGFTTGGGSAREWFQYSCTGGTCHISPSRIFHYTHVDTQLNVLRKFSGAGFFLQCGVVFGVNYINPDVNGPHGPVLFHVTCTRSGAGIVG